MLQRLGVVIVLGAVAWQNGLSQDQWRKLSNGSKRETVATPNR